MIKFQFILYFFLGLISCKPGNPARTLAQDNPQRQMENPVIDSNFPDPTVIKAQDGFYYAYATNTENNGKLLHIQVARSKNLSDWEIIGDALPDPPSWADKDFWAPHVLYDAIQQVYYLYYSGESVDPDLGKCMGVATSKYPEGPFKDKGQPLLCGETFVEIDPMAFDDPVTGKKYLYWGSGHEPIKVQELADNRLEFKAGSHPIELVDVIADDDPDNYQRLVEGAWVVYRDGYYYLFYSGDNCCGESAHYAVMVARSKNATGPFITLAEASGSANSVMLERNGRWIATGHNSVVTDSVGQDWMAYHGIDTLSKGKGRVMLLDKINWDNGWPKILLNKNQ